MTFFLFVISVTTLVYIYIGIRIIVPSRFRRRTKFLLWIGHFVLFFMPMGGFIFRMHNVSAGWLDNYFWIAYISLGFFTLLFALLAFYDFFRIISHLTGFFLTRFHPDSNNRQKPAEISEGGSDEKTLMNRRRFITNSVNAGLLGISGVMTLAGIKEARRVPTVEQVSVPITGLPAALHGFTIAQISDIHIGPTIKRDYVQEIVKVVKGLGCDLIAITGDLVDGRVDRLNRDAAPLADLKAPYGIYFVTGNHEYYSGVFSWIRYVSSLGIDVLINEHRLITVKKSKLLLAGVTDYTAGRVEKSHITSPGKAVKNAPKHDASVLLAHQPRSVYEASRHNIDLVLCGHTHGGQYYPWNLLVSLVQPYLKGLHKYEDTWIYVNRGTGYWGPPVRLGVPPEITRVKLVKG